MGKGNYIISGIGYILFFFLFANYSGDGKCHHWENSNDSLGSPVASISTSDYSQSQEIILAPFFNGFSQADKNQPFQGFIPPTGLLAILMEKASLVLFSSGLFCITPSLGIREIIFPFHLFW